MLRIRRFFALGGADRRLLLQALCWLAIARVMLATLPFSRLSARLSNAADPRPGADADPELPGRIGWAVEAAARVVPWRADCFPQAIAARMLLRRRGLGSTIHIGVAREEGRGLSGHAWLTCGEFVVTGGGGLEHYAVLHRLPGEQARA